MTNPNGGEQLQAGESHNVTWNAIDLSGTASIALYKGGTKAADIGTAPVNAETYSWNIPRSTAAGTDYRVRIIQGSNVDESNADFTILEANVPRIEVSPAALKFGASTTGASTQDQRVLLYDGKGGQLHWSASTSHSWLTVSPTSGTGDGYVTIGVDPLGLSAGTVTGSVSITDPDALNSPQTIAVTLEVQVSTAGPIGAFESPKDKAGVKGTIPLSGWALDDLGIASLEIRRNPVKDDPAGNIGSDGLVPVGTASFIPGSRPDIETRYSNYPLKQQSGWGYMLMSYDLPKLGNGTFVLHAIATDQEGNRVEVGKRTINASNKYNTKPFGVVDAPAWGETISGTAFADRAWMLTPRPKIIPTTGKTIWVWIDGVKRAHPVYNQARADIALKFPTLQEQGRSRGDLCYRHEELHQRAPYDQMGRVRQRWCRRQHRDELFQGPEHAVGRPLASISAVPMKAAVSEAAACGLLSDLAGIPQDYKTPLFRRTGFGAEGIFEPAFPDDQGVIEAVLEEDGLIEIRLGSSGPVKGYLVVGDELRPLPVGATLDPTGGMFSWMPGPGFLGRYDLVFVSQEVAGFSVMRRVCGPHRARSVHRVIGRIEAIVIDGGWKVPAARRVAGRRSCLDDVPRIFGEQDVAQAPEHPYNLVHPGNGQVG